MYRICLLVILLSILSCGAEKNKDEGDTHKKPIIAVVNYPLYYFTKSIAGEYVDVYLPALKGDPVYWKLDARQVNNFQKADLILANGAGYAKWMEKVSLPSSKIVNTSAGFQDKWIELEEEVTHSHGPEGEHVHRGIASTTWINFEFAIQQAEVIQNSLAKLLPDKTDELSSNFQKLKRELQALDSEMKTLAHQIGGDYLIASHPVYQYMERAYNFNIISMHWEPNEMPDEKEWINLTNTVRERKIKIMIWEDEPLPEIKSKLEKMGLNVVVFSPCGNRPEAGDFMEMMQENVEGLKRFVGLTNQ